MRIGDERSFTWYHQARNPLRRLQRSLLVESCRGGRILDVGGGIGRTANALAARGYEVIVLDRDFAMIDHGHRSYPFLRFVQGDACWLPFKSVSFDEAIFEEVIEHLEDQEGAVRETLEILKQGGRVVLSTPNKVPFRIYLFLMRLVTLRWSQLTKHVASHRAELTPSRLLELFAACTERRLIGLNPFCQRFARRFPMLGIGVLGIFTK